jgi:hypothetical protein
MYVMKNTNSDLALAASITWNASSQTYYTIRFLADRERVANAYRAYAYFRWVDDILDAKGSSTAHRLAFVQRQEAVLESSYQGQALQDIQPEEQMLVNLIRSDMDKDSGLQFYLRNMMAVMVFDVGRRGKLVSQVELNAYTRWLAGAVTEAMHYFIGNGDCAPRNETRYLAVSAAHITHMLRDTFDDVQAGYFNIAREAIEDGQFSPLAVRGDAYRAWVKNRVDLARLYFQRGKVYLAQVQNVRCRLAGFAYTARFEWLLDTFEREDYRVRPRYNERKSLGAALRMSWLAVAPLLPARHGHWAPQSIRAD